MTHPLLKPVDEAELFRIAVTMDREDVTACLHVERAADVFSVKLARAGRDVLYVCCARCGLEALRMASVPA